MKPFRMLMQGVSASGKTYLLKEILYTFLKGEFDEIFLICPTWQDQEIYRKMGIRKENKFITSTNETFDKIMEKCKNNKKENKKSLIILDDFLYTELSKNSGSLAENISTIRHKNTSIIVLSQYYKALPPVVRTNMDKVVSFRNDSETQINIMKEDYGDSWKNAYEDYTKEKYGYVCSDFCKSIYDGRHSNEITNEFFSK